MGNPTPFVDMGLFILKKKGEEMSIVKKVTSLVEDLLQTTKYRLYDVEQNAGILKITVNSPSGVTLDELAEINRKISHDLDEKDPIPSKYTLEVSSPGLERKLRTNNHFLGAVNEKITVKLGPHIEGDRRLEGILRQVTDELLTLETVTKEVREIKFQDVTQAKTVFEWEKNPKPGKQNGKHQVSSIQNR
ncbi:MAG: hypothetical protein CL421_00375 [Acidimicrobiaceae bacterium]|nr:hypothetical protein [Acidimicrobiaceae bacterium]OUV00013.1 MAG: hypothetical protein CBC37_05490 [Acidimicrobiaceae bacterium TMED77]